MAVTFSLGGVVVPGVQTVWNRIPLRTNNDGSLKFSNWLDHTWRCADLRLSIWDALQVIEGERLISMVSNHIESINSQVVYTDLIFESLTGTQRGHLMTNVEIRISVKKSLGTNWWLVPGLDATALIVYQPKGAVDFADSLINIVNPGTFDASPGVAPAFNAGLGWTFDGVDDFLDTSFVISGVNSMFVRINNMPDIDATGHIIGASAGGDYSFDWQGVMGSGGQVLNWNYPAIAIPFRTEFISVSLRDRVMGIYFEAGTRTSIFDQSISGISATNTTPTPTVFMGALSDGISPSDFFPGDIIAVAIYSGDINIVQAKQISANMAAL